MLVYFPSLCVMCKRNSEISSHLLLHCKFARERWGRLFGVLGVLDLSNQAITVDHLLVKYAGLQRSTRKNCLCVHGCFPGSLVTEEPSGFV